MNTGRIFALLFCIVLRDDSCEYSIFRYTSFLYSDILCQVGTEKGVVRNKFKYTLTSSPVIDKRMELLKKMNQKEIMR